MKYFKTACSSLAILDVIGPEIKLNNVEKSGSREQTISGGLISVIVIMLSIAVVIYFSLGLVIRKSPITYQVTRHEDITPTIDFNQNNMFFAVYFEPSSTFAKELPKFNDKMITYYANLTYFKNASTIATYDLRPCNFDKDFKGIQSLFLNYKDLINDIAYCVGDMHKDGKTIPEDSPEYTNLYIKDGLKSFSGEPIWVNFVAQRCINTTENQNHCYSQEIINKYLHGSMYSMLLIDNNFDSTNYEQPIQRFVSKINGMVSANTLSDNYLNFNNIVFRTYDAFLFDDYSDIPSYQIAERVEIVSNNNVGGSIVNEIFKFNFDPQNTVVTYERHYTRVQDVLAEIGGVIKALMLMGQLFNAIFFSFFKQKRFVANLLKFVRFSKPDDILASEAFTNTKVQFLDTKKTEKNENFEKVFLEPGGKIEKIGKLELEPLEGDRGSIEPIEIQTSKRTDMEKSAKMGLSQYYLKKTRTMITKTKDTSLDLYKICGKLKMDILNEKTIFQLYFDMQKFKHIFLTKEQRDAFDLIKSEYNEINEVPEKDFTLLLKKMLTSEDKISKILGERLFKENDM